MLIIGLTGERFVGKSEIVKRLVKHHGYTQAHSFGQGKAMFMAYLERKRVPKNIAFEMVYGNLKDVPSPYLPNNATPRFFTEKLGYFMGVELGPKWTLGVELDNLEYENKKKVVLDSVVYEEPLVRAHKGIIVRVTRPGNTNAHIDAPNTTEFQKSICEDIGIHNEGSLEDLHLKVDRSVTVFEERI